MATLLSSLFFMFKISLLSNYRVKYYDYIVKWCNGLACNWCVSLYWLNFSFTTHLVSPGHINVLHYFIMLC